ncbi:MAG: rane protein [Bacteroidetes bacterium]|nr:rane protein [Bacteroidota bacterium]
MKRFLFNLFNSESRYRILVQNFSYLSSIQIINVLLPLVVYPYLIKTLGTTFYGLVIFSQAVINYFVIFVGFGFNISATKQISIYRDQPSKLDEIVSSVLIIKSLLFIFALFLLLLLINVIPHAKDYKLLFFLSMWACIYDVVFPVWYFQGVEKMKFITLITLVSRFVFFVLVFLFIISPIDYILFPLINGFASLLGGGIALWIIFFYYKRRFIFQPFRVLKFYFMDSIPIFISNISSSLYVSTNKVIVGSFLTLGDVAYYDIAEKITTVLKIPQSILGQTLFPKMNKDRDISFIKKIFKLTLIFHAILLLFLFVSSKYVILLLGGEQMLPAFWVVNLMSLMVPITAMSNVFGIQILIAFDYSKKFSKIILNSGLAYFILVSLIFCFSSFNLYNITVVSLLTEIFVAFSMYFSCRKLNLW